MNKSHNVYSEKHNYRIRIYRDDKKFFEKQLVMPKMQYYSISQQAQDILARFIEKIGEELPLKNNQEYFIAQTLNKLNCAYIFGNLLKELINDNTRNVIR